MTRNQVEAADGSLGLLSLSQHRRVHGKLMFWVAPTDRVLFMQIQLVKILLLWEKQLLMKPPHAFGSHLAKKSDTDVVC